MCRQFYKKLSHLQAIHSLAVQVLLLLLVALLIALLSIQAIHSLVPTIVVDVLLLLLVAPSLALLRFNKVLASVRHSCQV